MSAMISFCGIACNECEAFLATKDNDDQQRAKVAEEWSKLFATEIKPEDINCEGCLSDSKNVFNHCNVCLVRKCGKEKGVVNCAHCSDYACEILNNLHQMIPDTNIVKGMKEMLEKERAMLK